MALKGGGGGEGEVDLGGILEEDGMVVGGAVCTLLGAGGINGTLTSSVFLEEVGVAGVGALPDAEFTAPGGGGTLTGAAELWVPGRNAGSELRIEDSWEPDWPFLPSAKKRWSPQNSQRPTAATAGQVA